MVFVPASDDRWVDENYARLAELITAYDRYLELRWIPPEKRTIEDKKPYMVVDTQTNTPVLFASELDSPQEILARIIEADNSTGNVLNKIDAANAAADLFRMKERTDMMAEASDKALFLLKSPLHTVKMDGKIFDHQRRVI